MLATLPRFREMERDFGSLIRAMRRQMRKRPKPSGESGARYSMFVTLARRAVEPGRGDRRPAAARRRAIEHAGCAHRTSRRRAGAVAEGREGGEAESGREDELLILLAFHPPPRPPPFDALILATPSPVAAKLLQPLDAALAADLGSIAHRGTAIVSLGYD